MATRTRPNGCCTTPITVSRLNPAERDALVAGFRALSDPTRLEIYHLISAQSEPICVCDIVDCFNLSQPTISHHLKTLREAGLVTVTRRGIWAFYEANPVGFAHLRGWIAAQEVIPTEELAAVG